jgi:hypothetical protein
VPNRNDQMNFHDLNHDEDDIVRNFNQLIQKNQYFNSEDEALNVLWIYLQKRLEGGDKIIVNDHIIDLSNPRKEVPFTQQLLFTLLKRNVAVLYQYSDPNSPIEKAFLSLFMIHVMVNYSFAIIIEPYIADTNQTPEAYMEKRRADYEKTMRFHHLYQERTGKTKDQDFLNFLMHTDEIMEQERSDYIDYFLFWQETIPKRGLAN